MGITIKSKNCNADLGYGGFGRFRSKVASLSSETFGKHFEDVKEGLSLWDSEQESFYKKYDKRTYRLIDSKEITHEIANFCYQSDCEGSIDQQQAKQIYEKIKDYNDDICYGYVGTSDCAMFSDLKKIFKDCAEHGGKIKWR